MDSRKFPVGRIVVLVFFVLVFMGCSDKEKMNTENSYYIDLVNFTKDSLKQQVAEALIGKVSFHKNEKLEILSLNYVVKDYPDMHYFIAATDLKEEIKPGTKKIEIKFEGEYSIDSITYSLSKFIYNDKKWVVTSSMKLIKATTTYKKAKEFSVKEYGKQIVNNTVLYTYN